MENFGHYLLPLLPHPRQQGALGGNAQLSPRKEAGKIAERIQGCLKVSDRVEVAILPSAPDFFGESSGQTKVRNQIWATIRSLQNLRVVILTRHPEAISKLLPTDWHGNGYSNVCFGIVADGTDDFAAKIQSLRDVPARHRMILVPPTHHHLDLRGKLAGIQWVVVIGPHAATPEVEAITSACMEADVPLHFHHSQGENPQPPHEEAAECPGNTHDRPDHPFGPKVMLTRPIHATLQAYAAELCALSSPPKNGLTTDQPATPAKISPAPPPTDSVPIEAAPPAMERKSPASAATQISSPTEIFVNCPIDEITVITNNPAVENVETGTAAELTEKDRADFMRLHQLVMQTAEMFVEAGIALREIRDRKLWQAGNYANWSDYCESVQGITRRYANLLIQSAETISTLREVGNAFPTSTIPEPYSVNHALLLRRIKDPLLRYEAWNTAVQRANGQPSVKQLEQTVVEILGKADQPTPPQAKTTRKQQRGSLMEKLKLAVEARCDWDLVSRLLTALEVVL